MKTPPQNKKITPASQAPENAEYLGTPQNTQVLEDAASGNIRDLQSPDSHNSARKKMPRDIASGLKNANASTHLGMPSAMADVDSAQAPPTIRTISILPPQLIQPNEIIILMLKPSLWYIPLNSLKSILVSMLLAFTIAYVEYDFPHLLGIRKREALFFIFLALSLKLFIQSLDWLSRYYILTDKRIICVQGITNIQIFETPLQNILHTNTLFPLKQRLLALGSISFSTAGSAGVDAYWLMINKPLEIHRIVIQTLAKYRQ